MGFEDVRHLAVMRGGAIGDLVLTLPAIHALRRAFPQACLSLIGNPDILCLAGGDRILNHNNARFAPLYSDLKPLPPTTRHFFEETDLLLAYSVDPRGVLAEHLNPLIRFKPIIHDPRPASTYSSHIIEHLLAPLHQWGLLAPDPTPRIHPRAIDRTYAAHCQQVHQLIPPLVVLHPGSGGRYKCWPPPHFAKLIHRLHQCGNQVALLYGPAEEALILELKNQIPPSCATLHPPGLPELAGLLEGADLFIGNDSGPTHIAAALGTPTIALFGPTNPRIWGPRGGRVHIIQAPAGDLNALGLDSVLEVAFEHLGRKGHEDGWKQRLG